MSMLSIVRKDPEGDPSDVFAVQPGGFSDSEIFPIKHRKVVKDHEIRAASN